MTRGKDGTIWFTEDTPSVGHISATGTITELPLPKAVTGPLAYGSDGNLWVLEAFYVARITCPTDAGIDAGVIDVASDSSEAGVADSGGFAATGGMVGSGGVIGNGGTSGTGGAFGTGGISGTGGTSGTGGGITEGKFVVGVTGLTVTDTSTGLVWQRDGSGSRPNCVANPRCTWAEAQTYCAGLTLGVSGWLLPTLDELKSLVDNTVTSGATIDQTAFPNTPAEAFWTSSPYLSPLPPGVSGNAWYDIFFDGGSVSYGMGNSFRVRCVR